MGKSPVLVAALLLSGLAWSARSARAADLERYVPDETNVLLVVNVEQVAEHAPLAAVDAIATALVRIGRHPDVDALLTLTGIDPVEDVGRLVIACTRWPQLDRSLLIAHGKYDSDRFTRAINRPPRGLDVTKKTNGRIAYYAAKRNPLLPALFISLLDTETVVASWDEQLVRDAIARKTGGTKSRLPAVMRAGVKTIDPKRSLSFAALGKAFEYTNVSLIHGSLHFHRTIGLEFCLKADSLAEARKIGEEMPATLKRVLAQAMALTPAKDSRRAKMVASLFTRVLKDAKVTRKDRDVWVHAAATVKD
jgi:hypothetical protein